MDNVAPAAMDTVAPSPMDAAGAAAPAAADRRDVSEAKPLLRGWLHLVWFEASLVAGTLVLARAHGGVRIMALAIFTVAVWLHSGPEAGALMLAGGLLYIAGALSYQRRRPDPYPSVFGYHEVFHVYVCAAATCQYIAIALFIA